MPVPMPKSSCRVRARERINRIPPSAERNERVHSSDFGVRPQGGPLEANPDLPSLPDLLEELESDAFDLNSLEQLTQTLLEDIARDLESAAQKAADQESIPSGERVSGKVVGPPPKELEPSRNEVLKKEVSVEHDISEYLLLHHNYAKTKPTPRKPPTSTRKLKTIHPRSRLSVQSKAKALNNEMLYGTFDQNTNTITILINEDSIPLNEVILETNTAAEKKTSNSLTIPARYESNSSPRSDLGYESVDSEMDNWDPSVSELFPSLL